MTAFPDRPNHGTGVAVQGQRGPAAVLGRFRSAADARGKRGLAFVVEALLLLAFLAASVAVFMQLFGGASVRGAEAARLERAVVLAANTAEYFAADPSSVPREFQDRGFVVRTQITSEPQPAGTLYFLSLTVFTGTGESVYTLETSRYMSGVFAGSGQEVA